MSDKLQKFVENFPWVKNLQTPWSLFAKKLANSRVALISTGGVYMSGDIPFEVNKPEDVDESFRRIPLAASIADLRLAHLHFDQTNARRDMNVVFPIERLQELADEGFLGNVSETNYSISGYIPNPKELYTTSRMLAKEIKGLGVDAVLITPV